MLKFWKKKKVAVYNPHIEFAEAKTKVIKAFGMFSEAHKTIQDANAQLSAAVLEHDKNINSLESRLTTENLSKQKALDEIQANTNLATELQKFVPQR
jgi:hypothetical protein